MLRGENPASPVTPLLRAWVPLGSSSPSSGVAPSLPEPETLRGAAGQALSEGTSPRGESAAKPGLLRKEQMQQMQPQIAAAGWAGSPGAWPMDSQTREQAVVAPKFAGKAFPCCCPCSASCCVAVCLSCLVAQARRWFSTKHQPGHPGLDPHSKEISLMVTAGLSRASPFLLVSLQVFQVVVQENLHREEIRLH